MLNNNDSIGLNRDINDDNAINQCDEDAILPQSKKSRHEVEVPLQEAIIESSVDITDTSGVEQAKQEMNNRIAELTKFLMDHGINKSMSKKKIRDLANLSVSALESFKLNTLIAYACKNMDLKFAFDSYINARDRNIFPNPVSYLTLLNLTAGLGEQGMGLGPIRTAEPPSDYEAALVVFEDMRRRSLPLMEPVYSAVIRCCCRHHRIDQALTIYREFRATGQMAKLRTFITLLESFANNAGYFDFAAEVWSDMRQVYNLSPTEREYCAVLRCCVLNDRSEFYKYLDGFMDDVFVPSVDSTWPVIEQWFSTRANSLKPSRFFVCRSAVSENGFVAKTGDVLESVDLTEECRQELLSQLEGLATMEDAVVSERSGVTENLDPGGDITAADNEAVVSVGEDRELVLPVKSTAKMDDSTGGSSSAISNAGVSGGRRKKRGKRCLNAEERQKKFDHFKSWIIPRFKNTSGAIESNPALFDVIVDGANVGYFQQNFANAPGHVDYTQIDWMLMALQLKSFKPCLILHCRHLFTESVPAYAVPLLQKWQASGILYTTPVGCNDDWYWMFAGVKTNCYIVSNDEMRDHHFQMLSPRWFSRWRERHQIYFSFGQWEQIPITSSDIKELTASTDAVDTSAIIAANSNVASWRKPELQIPAPYSHRMQIVRSMPSDSANGRLEGCDWSIPRSIDRTKPRYYFPGYSEDSADENSELWLCAYEEI